jgi:hypothetical protein
MNNPLVIVLLSWFLPGSGYLILGKLKRGLLVGGIVWVMFIIAIISGGAYYPGLTFNEGAMLYLLNIFARLGNGLGAFVSFWLNMSPPLNVAAWGTFEYGGRFLEIAGLLNFLAIIDVFDIYKERKK